MFLRGFEWSLSENENHTLIYTYTGGLTRILKKIGYPEDIFWGCYFSCTCSQGVAALVSQSGTIVRRAGLSTSTGCKCVPNVRRSSGVVPDSGELDPARPDVVGELGFVVGGIVATRACSAEITTLGGTSWRWNARIFNLCQWNLHQPGEGQLGPWVHLAEKVAAGSNIWRHPAWACDGWHDDAAVHHYAVAAAAAAVSWQKSFKFKLIRPAWTHGQASAL